MRILDSERFNLFRRNRRICGHASHVKKLVHAESQEIEQVSIDARDSAAHTLGENRIDRPAMTEHSVHELAQPAAIARVEVRRSFLERCVEQLTTAKISADLRCRYARRCNATDDR